jgi:hypothetical protein
MLMTDHLDELWTLEDSLSGVCSDLLSERRFEPFVLHLFASPLGTWRTVADCCDGLTELPRHATDVFSEHEKSLVVTHLEFPERNCAGFSVILFFHKDNLWSMTASYNRERLLTAHAKQ